MPTESFLSVQDKYLHQLFLSEKINLGSVERVLTIAEAPDVFSYIDGNFTRWGKLELSGVSVRNMSVTVYEALKGGKFSDF